MLDSENASASASAAAAARRARRSTLDAILYAAKNLSFEVAQVQGYYEIENEKEVIRKREFTFSINDGTCTSSPSSLY
jgi:uncharacterized protein YfcZ (UPF0381/DUF406 family)